jgi:hypothetical protein
MEVASTLVQAMKKAKELAGMLSECSKIRENFQKCAPAPLPCCSGTASHTVLRLTGRL